MCDCGAEITASSANLKSGHVQSCGCLRSELSAARKRTHNMRHSKEYQAWNSMRNRCNNSKVQRYANYGGRGIKVCKEWESSFEAFLKDMGRCPSPNHSIDRIDNNGNYEPGNCRWATRRTQANNKSDTAYFTFNGVRDSVGNWSEKTGIKPSTILARISRGWPEAQILSPLLRQTPNESLSPRL